MTEVQNLLYNQYTKNSNLPSKYLSEAKLFPQTVDVETFKQLKNIEDNIKDFVQEGNNLLICSHCAGNGKTSWATRLLKAYVESYACNYSFKANPITFVNIPEFLEMKKQAIKRPELQSEVDKIEDGIYNSKLVVFDDISSKEVSDYDMNSLYCWINYRTSRNMSSIYTSNATPSDLMKTLSENIVSRIVGYSYVKEILGGDRRIQNNKKW